MMKFYNSFSWDSFLTINSTKWFYEPIDKFERYDSRFAY